MEIRGLDIIILYGTKLSINKYVFLNTADDRSGVSDPRDPKMEMQSQDFWGVFHTRVRHSYGHLRQTI